ncbi:hypothetical protein [Aeromonas jandaei]|uniref:hypothetical protein n=1 Tax=Aeromonas jandaei TaxID=650 RepID=UPI003EC70A1E
MLDLLNFISESEWKALNTALPALNSILTFLGFLIVSSGWFVTGWLNRRLEVSKQRMIFRQSALDSVIEVGKQIHKQTIDGVSIEKAQVQLLIYGYPDEIALVNKLVSICTSVSGQPSESQVKDLRETNAKLMNLVRNRIRKQVGLKKLKN